MWGGAFTGPLGEEYSQPVEFDDAGRVVGYSRRYDATPGVEPPPSSAWIDDPEDGAMLIGLIDEVHTRGLDGFELHQPRGMNSMGVVVGVSWRFDTSSPFLAGQSAWVWSSEAGTRRVGLEGARYIEQGTNLQYTYVLPPSADGDVIGASWSFVPGAQPGRDAWVLAAGASTPVRLGFIDSVHTSPSGEQRSEPTVLPGAGGLRVLGYSARYNAAFGFPEGRTAWRWTPGDGLLDIGLADAEHTGSEGQRDSVPVAEVAGGAVVGIAGRYSGTSTRSGQSVWVWTPPTTAEPQGRTIRLGLTDELHTDPAGFRRNELYGWTDGGIVYGVSYRYNGRVDADITNGRTIWVYDVRTGVQQELVFSTSAQNDALALPLGATDDGVVTGYYLEYDDAGIAAQRAFVWDAARGGTTINAMLRDGPLANDMENAFFGASFDDATGVGVVYAMPPGVIWTPAGVGSWAVAYRLERAAPCDPDFNADGNVDQDDIACLAQVVAGDPACSGFDPDFNGDGNVDQDDIDALAQVVAGAECP